MTYDCLWVTRDEAETEGLTVIQEKIEVAAQARAEIAANRPLEEVSQDIDFIAAHTLVLGLCDQFDENRVSYFGTNNSGMSTIVGAMAVLGMGQWTREQWPSVPEPDLELLPEQVQMYLAVERQFLAEPERLPELLPGFDPASITDVQRRAYAELDQAGEQVLAHVPSDVRGMCLDKFVDNSGWVVTPRECESAVRLWGCALTGSRMVSLEVARVAAAEYAALTADARRDRAVAAAAAVGLVELPLDEELVLLFADSEWLEWLRFIDGAISHDGFSVL